MSLAELQRALARVCLDPEVNARDLAALGGPCARWMTYRDLVRGRFHDTVSEALPRTREALGPVIFGGYIDRWLALSPPRTRYVRELALEFVQDLTGRLSPEDAARAPFVLDLVRYERAVIEVIDAVDEQGAACEFEMHLRPVFSPAARFLRLGFELFGAVPRDGAQRVLLYRDGETHRIETLSLSATAAELTEAMLDGRSSVTECAKALLARLPEEAHRDFASELAELLGEYLDRGVILGSR